MNPLALSNEAYRQVYDRIAQLALDYLAGIGERSCFPDISADEASNLFAGTVPEQGMGAAAPDDLTKFRTTAAEVDEVVDEVLKVGNELSSGAQS